MKAVREMRFGYEPLNNCKYGGFHFSTVHDVMNDPFFTHFAFDQWATGFLKWPNGPAPPSQIFMEEKITLLNFPL